MHLIAYFCDIFPRWHL